MCVVGVVCISGSVVVRPKVSFDSEIVPSL